MDIATRLKEFLDHTGMQSTQFADACGIPRPSFSQLLRGRNRKVSDEVIAKIHESFPQLSILWLMFGEGEMVTSPNIEISEPENSVNPPLFSNESADMAADMISKTVPENVRDFQQSTHIPPLPGMNSSEFIPGSLPFTMPTDSTPKNVPTYETPVPVASLETTRDGAVSGGADHKPSENPQRRVVSIMVFYSDRSFETFVPEKSH